MKHMCHAIGCSVEVHSKLLLCPVHWYMVPKELRDSVWREYRRGQGRNKRPSQEYLSVARSAITAVREIERQGTNPRL